MTNKEIALQKGIKEEFIKILNDVDCVLYAGLLDLAHREGIPDSKRKFLGFDRPEVFKLDLEKKECVVIATARFENDFKVSAIGHTSSTNIGGDPFTEHFIVIAETRAKARALRDALNIPLVSKEELFETKSPHNGLITEAQKNKIEKCLTQLGKGPSFLSAFFKKFETDSIDNFTVVQASKVIKKLEEKIASS